MSWFALYVSKGEAQRSLQAGKGPLPWQETVWIQFEQFISLTSQQQFHISSHGEWVLVLKIHYIKKSQLVALELQYTKLSNMNVGSYKSINIHMKEKNVTFGQNTWLLYMFMNLAKHVQGAKLSANWTEFFINYNDFYCFGSRTNQFGTFEHADRKWPLQRIMGKMIMNFYQSFYHFP